MREKEWKEGRGRDTERKKEKKEGKKMLIPRFFNAPYF